MKILIVEDDIMLADSLEDSLRACSFEVCGIANNVADGISLIQQQQPQLVILDMHLDGELGSDIVDRLPRADLINIGVLYITGLSEHVMQHDHVGHAVLGKPYGLATLAKAIDVVMEIVAGKTPTLPLPYGLQLLRHDLSLSRLPPTVTAC